MRHSKTSGPCPYCGGTSFNEGTETRPGHRVDQCQTCDQHSVSANRARYPLLDPTNPASPPYA